MKLLGDMYLLAGMYGDAIKCFDDGAEKCRAVGDVLWEGVAREGRAVAGIGEAWEGRDGSVSYPAVIAIKLIVRIHPRHCQIRLYQTRFRITSYQL
jgi:hypothetical protein